MIAALATFALVVLIIVGAYWLFVVLPEHKDARALEKRLRAESSHLPTRTELTKKTQPLSALKPLDALLTRSHHLVRPLEKMITLAALPVTVGVVVLAGMLLATLIFLLVAIGTSRLAPAGLVAVAAAAVPVWYVRLAARRRLRRLEEQFPQAVDLIAASLRAGHALPTSLLMVAEELDEPLGTEFQLLHDQQTYGKPLPDVLKQFAERVPLLDVRIFVTAVMTQRETGGNLAEILDKLSSVIRERFRLRRQVRAVSAHGRITGWVLVCLPPAVAAALYAIVPDHVSILFTDPLGLQLTVVAIVMQVIGTLAIRRIVDIEI
jgi:tight adherence protein B